MTAFGHKLLAIDTWRTGASLSHTVKRPRASSPAPPDASESPALGRGGRWSGLLMPLTPASIGGGPAGFRTARRAEGVSDPWSWRQYNSLGGRGALQCQSAGKGDDQRRQLRPPLLPVRSRTTLATGRLQVFLRKLSATIRQGGFKVGLHGSVSF